MKKIYKELIIFFLLAIIVNTWGFSSMLLQIDITSEKYSYLLNLSLIGVFISAILYTKRDKKINLFASISLIGSMISILFIGIQGIYFNPKLGDIKNTISFLGVLISTIGTTIMFTGLIAITKELIHKTFLSLKKI